MEYFVLKESNKIKIKHIYPIWSISGISSLVWVLKYFFQVIIWSNINQSISWTWLQHNSVFYSEAPLVCAKYGVLHQLYPTYAISPGVLGVGMIESSQHMSNYHVWSYGSNPKAKYWKVTKIKIKMTYKTK